MLELALLVVGVVGIASSLYVSYRLAELYKITDDVSYKLASAAFVVFAIALALEALSFTFQAPTPRCLNCPWRGYFQNVAPYRWAFVSYSLYLVAYTLYLASSLVSGKVYSMLPFMFMVAGEQNLLILVLLIVSFFIAFDNKNKLFVAFYGTLAASHALDALVLAYPSGAQLFLSIAFVLRSLAPLMLTCFARCKA